ncbi:hypothetical protein, partial [Bacteroides uniformis]|uniref:hypothetical protein n=1 Tax=Bacteroides uniformis TaxID=820 RepID=UPI0039B66C55
MAKSWATFCCPGTYKNNYQSCCGIKAVIKAIEDSYFLSFGETYGHKKRSTAVLQPLLTLNLIL